MSEQVQLVLTQAGSGSLGDRLIGGAATFGWFMLGIVVLAIVMFGIPGRSASRSAGSPTRRPRSDAHGPSCPECGSGAVLQGGGEQRGYACLNCSHQF